MALDAGTLFPLAVVAAIAGGGRGRRRGGSGGGILSSMLQSMQQEEQQRLAHDLQTQREREGYRMQLLLPLVQEAVTKGIGVDEFKDMLAGVGIDPEQLGSMRREFFESGRGEETRNLARLLDGDAMTRYLGEDTYGGMNRWVGSDEGRDAMRRGPLVDVFLKNAQTPQGLDALGMLPGGGRGLLAALFEDPASAMAGMSGGTLQSKKLEHSQRLAQIGAQKADRGGSAPAGPEDIMKYELSMWLHDNKARRASGEPELPMPEYLRPYAAKLGLVEKPQEPKAKGPRDVFDERLAAALERGGEIPEELRAYAETLGLVEKPQEGKGLSRTDYDQIRKNVLGYDDGGFFTKGLASVATSPEAAIRALRAAYGYNEDALSHALGLLNETETLPNRGKNPLYGKMSGTGGQVAGQGSDVAAPEQGSSRPRVSQQVFNRVKAGLDAGKSPSEILRQAEASGNQAVVQQVRLALETIARTGAGQ